ncbi:MAG: DNA polymerase III subunit gamma/tau [Candidatus Omnitrophica bacterium]|nr:DNA polymerase III subunit gamma/tau [Candidatus Omnitrophota bacterium]
MEYLAFALKYRPQNFEQVIGQEHIVVSLRNAILKDRVSHAYIFSGPRGIGKTSLARIFAKSLNCAEGPTAKPCGKCPSCLAITKGKSLDIIEIDGASNRGIDEIRTLRENVKLSPAGSRYKIYIIDEVHMLTQEAFNALLKTLEEPPPHVKFIFATTHPHKILPTILSRCQKFQFNLIALENIVAKLRIIAKSEKIKIEDSLLYTIGRAAAGSIRDAESLFDQLAPVVLEKGSLKDVFSFLGIIDEESLNKALKALLDKDIESCLEFIDRLAKDGKDLGIFLNAFIEHLRNLLLAKVSSRTFQDLSDVSPQSKDFIIELAKTITTFEVLRAIDLLIEAKDISKRLNTVRIPLELALIRYSHQEESEEVQPQAPKKINKPDLPKSNEPPNSTIEGLDSIDFEDDDEPVKSNSQDDKKEDIMDIDQDDAPQDNTLLQPMLTKWQQMIAYMQKKRAAIASHLTFAQPISSKGRCVTIAFSPADYFHKEIVESAKNVKFIEAAIAHFISQSPGVKFILRDLPDRPKIKSAPDLAESENSKQNTDGSEKAKPSQAVSGDDDAFLNNLLDTFDGKFHSEDQ